MLYEVTIAKMWFWQVKELAKSKAEATRRLANKSLTQGPAVRQALMAALVANDITSSAEVLRMTNSAQNYVWSWLKKLQTLSSKKAQEAGLLFIAVQSAGPDAVSAAAFVRSVPYKHKMGLVPHLSTRGRVRRAAAESLRPSEKAQL